MTTFTIPGKPQPKQRPRKAKGRWYTPKATKNYEEKVALYARSGGVKEIDGPVALSMAIYMPDRRRRDLDNCAKTVCDGLNGIAYEDDSQVSILHVERYFDTDNPRVEVTVIERLFTQQGES